MEVVLEAGADDIDPKGQYYEIVCDPSHFEAVKGAIEAQSIPTVTAEVMKIPNSYIKVTGNEAKQVLSLMESLEDHEDIQAVHANFDIPDDEMEKASE